MIDKEKKKLIVELLSGRFSDLRAIYLFGSSLTPDLKVPGDIDLAVLSLKLLPPWDRWKTAQDLAIRLKSDVDLIDLRRTSIVMQFQIIFSGQCLYEKIPEDRERYEDVVFCSYIRLNEERSGILEDMYTRGSVYG
jgi:predicted nucleotidyltransferase